MRIKICGITRPEDAVVAARAGADAIGLVFHEPSSRAVDARAAAAICAALPPFVTRVGLFVDAPPARIDAVLAEVPLDVLQFHGAETPETCRRHGRPYLRALRVGAPGWDRDLEAWRDAQALLLDAWVPDCPGGTGRTFDWDRIPGGLPRPLVLAGGLTPDNVGGAVGRARPAAVDVSGGVESAPGRKDPSLVRRFIHAARAAAAAFEDAIAHG